jgi:hypothetical protein
MMDGIEQDDGYRMVEDELRAVAGHFTAHLHAAEYQRLKILARSQNAESIQSLARPVSGIMTDQVRRRQALSSYIKKRDRGLRSALGRRAVETTSDVDDNEGDEVEELTGVGTSLQGLMNSPRKKQVPLSRILPQTSVRRDASATNTVSADGEREDEGDDDDLDTKTAQSHSILQMRNRPAQQPNPHGNLSSTPPAVPESTMQDVSSDDEPFWSHRRRRMERATGGKHNTAKPPKREATEVVSLDTIPSFF